MPCRAGRGRAAKPDQLELSGAGVTPIVTLSLTRFGRRASVRMLHDAECRFEMRNVSSVDKALRILLLLAREPGPLGVREIGRRLGMSAPTVHRLLTTLGRTTWFSM